MTEDDSTETTNRRSVLKNVAAGALAVTASGGAASAAHSSSGGIENQSGCVREWTEYRCVDSGCDCSDPCADCDCDTKRQSRQCCEDTIGHTLCYAWSDTGNCCSSC